VNGSKMGPATPDSVAESDDGTLLDRIVAAAEPRSGPSSEEGARDEKESGMSGSLPRGVGHAMMTLESPCGERERGAEGMEIETRQEEQRREEASLFRFARCLKASEPQRAGVCQVCFDEGAEKGTAQWVPYLEGLCLRDGQTVLVAKAGSNGSLVVIGGLKAGGTTQHWSSPGGQSVVVEGYARDSCSAIRVLSRDGSPALEVDLTGMVPTLRLGGEDVELNMTGRLRIAARSIELESTLGSVVVKANDDFKVDAERIRLN
jgi:hypothetical protein